jgi:hypothetical protein
VTFFWPVFGLSCKEDEKKELQYGAYRRNALFRDVHRVLKKLSEVQSSGRECENWKGAEDGCLLGRCAQYLAAIILAVRT